MQQMEARGIVFPIKDLETSTRISKQARIRSLQPKFEDKKIFLRKTQLSLIDQILRFPQIPHDDLLDALKSQMEITFPCDKRDEDYKRDQNKPRLSPKEEKIWEGVDKLGKRRVNEVEDIEYI